MKVMELEEVNLLDELESQMKDPNQLVDAKEIARLTDYPISSIWRAVREGSLPHYRLGRAIRFDRNEVLAVMRRARDEQRNGD